MAQEEVKVYISEPTQKPEVKNTFLGGFIVLNPGISTLNFFAYMGITVVLSLCLQPFFYLKQALLANVYGMTIPDAKDLIAWLNSIDLLVKLLMFPVLGYLCDKYSRKPFMLMGVVLTCVPAMISGDMPALYPWFVIQHLIGDLGTGCTTIVPLLADYIDDSTKGRMAGIIVILMQANTYIATLIISYMDIKTNLPFKYHIFGGVGLIFGLAVVIIGIKGGSYHRELHRKKRAEKEEAMRRQAEEEARRRSTLNPELTPQDDQPLIVKEENYPPGIIAGLRQAKKFPILFAAFLMEFMAMGQMQSLGFMFSVYIVQLAGTQNAAAQAVILTNKKSLVGIFSAATFGLLSDKINRFALMLIAVTSGLVASSLIIIMPTPYGYEAYIAMIFFGISTTGLRTLINGVISTYPEPKYRASVMSVGQIMSVCGTASIGVLGLHFSNDFALLPYYMNVGFASVTLLILTILFISRRQLFSVVNN